MVYDPAWDMPQLNWKQQGSFEGGAVPPVTEPDAGTQVFLGPIAQEWMPYICGALDQLRNPSAWIVADDTAMYNTLRRVDTLLGLICGGRADCVPTQMRFLNCVLETSVDGGVTWVPVPGWITDFPGCVRDAIPPPPPLPPGVIINQRACNLAGYLATELIVRAMARASNDWNAGARNLNDAVTLFDMYLGYAFPETAFALTAFNLFWGHWTAGTVAQFTAAAADPVLLGEVACAIYNAIKNDGQVTDGNFPTLVANVCAIVYVPAVIVPAICDLVTGAGAANMRYLQVAGAYETFDCTACGGWCYQWDFRVSAGPFIPNGGVPAPVYTPGTGWVSSASAGQKWLEIAINLAPDLYLTSACIKAFVPWAAAGAGREINCYLDGVLVHSAALPLGDGGAGYVVWCIGAINHICDQVVFLVDAAQGGTSAPMVIVQSAELTGNGPNPFGVDNCTY